MSDPQRDERSFPRRRLFDALERITGRDYAPYLFEPFEDALHHRVQATGCDDIDAYFQFLESNPDEAHTLEARALVGITRFFRNPESFDALGKQIHNLLADTPGRQSPFRVWVPACSTGQEAYSLAIQLREIVQILDVQLTVRIVGSDINADAIKFAQHSRYDPRELRSLDPKRRQAFFQHLRGAYEPSSAIRQWIWFMVHDVLTTPPFGQLDLISCRNLLIYLHPQHQCRVMENFARHLRPGGLLFLGASETTVYDCEYFTLLDPDHRIFTRNSRM